MVTASGGVAERVPELLYLQNCIFQAVERSDSIVHMTVRSRNFSFEHSELMLSGVCEPVRALEMSWGVSDASLECVKTKNGQPVLYLVPPTRQILERYQSASDLLRGNRVLRSASCRELES